MDARVTTSTPVAAFASEAAVIEAARGRGEPDWLIERRAEAARAFAAAPLPTHNLRPWKYTDVSGLDFAAFPPAAATLTLEATPPEGSHARSLAAVAGASEGVRDDLGSVIPATEGKFTALNAALWQDGVGIYAARGAAFAAPVIVTLDVANGAAGSVFPRILIHANEQSDVTVVLRLHSDSAPLLVAGVIEIIANQASTVRVLVDERWGAATQDYSIVRSRVGRDASVQVATLAIGGHVFKQTVEAVLDQAGGRSVIRGVALGDGTQHFDFVTLQDHVAPKTISDVEIKAALAGASRSIYYGVTRVGEGAAGGEAMQTNRNLLLSDSAKADSDPVLEILTADVAKCGHAATVGPVDGEALFYLQSRGLDYRTALQLMVAGFFQSAIADISIEGFREELAEIVAAKLATSELRAGT
ncbi:MAG: SufD family Fe-S cluster assembly protein [Dehalococcoidia bacterium]|nr:SufD family Fe-S cluster assembly protein [Dehalococcoidia bacterium]